MSKQIMIRQALDSIDSAGFPLACNRYLKNHIGGELHSPGIVAAKYKTKTGKPDTYLRLNNDTYVLAEMTTKNSEPARPLLEKFDVLDDKGIIYHHSAKKLATLLNDLIPGLNISGRALDTYPALYAQMKPYFEQLLSGFLK